MIPRTGLSVTVILIISGGRVFSSAAAVTEIHLAASALAACGDPRDFAGSIVPDRRSYASCSWNGAAAV